MSGGAHLDQMVFRCAATTVGHNIQAAAAAALRVERRVHCCAASRQAAVFSTCRQRRCSCLAQMAASACGEASHVAAAVLQARRIGVFMALQRHRTACAAEQDFAGYTASRAASCPRSPAPVTPRAARLPVQRTYTVIARKLWSSCCVAVSRRCLGTKAADGPGAAAVEEQAGANAVAPRQRHLPARPYLRLHLHRDDPDGVPALKNCLLCLPIQPRTLFRA